MKEIPGKVAFVTGGASGIGFALAKRFLDAGMKVAITDVERSALNQACDALATSEASLLPIHLDVTDRVAMREAADSAEANLGAVHILCNNAGVAVGGAVNAMSYEDWDWVMGVNVGGVINGIQTFLPRMLAHGEPAHIVNTASMAGHRAARDFSIYNTSKFAVVGMSEAIRLDLADTNVAVSVLCPGVANTRILKSWRNRPESLKTKDELASRLIAAGKGTHDQRSDAIAQTFSQGLAPDLIADMVLHAIEHDHFYIFTHPDLATATARRNDAIQDSFRDWADYLEHIPAID